MTENIEAPVLELEEDTAVSTEMQNEALTPEDKTKIYQHAKRVIEGVLFCSSEPLTLRRMTNVLQTYHQLQKVEVKQLVEELALDYEQQDRSFRLVEIANGYILRTCEELSPYIHALLKTARPEKLSHAATEVLAIIAYRQPITRPQIDEIRGVDSSGIVSTLIERQLIEPTGKLEVPGRPMLYGVTHNFLKYFGLKDLKELPDLGIKIPKAIAAEPAQEEKIKEASEENKITEPAKNTDRD
jgi:segregation and condensation protein B